MRAWLFLIVLIIPVVVAQEPVTQGTVTLLTVVGDDPNTTVGGTAAMTLEIHEGSGQIFIESRPLTQIDTQISTRFATEYACNFLSVDCNNYDFFYTIRANSGVVQGPSAGASTAVLAIALLDGQTPRRDIALTGTINSGGVVGPVGGVPKKVEAANRLAFVLIPQLNYLTLNETNQSLNVKPVTLVEDALWHYTGKNYSSPYKLRESKAYQDLMEDTAAELCEDYEELQKMVFNKSHYLYNSSVYYYNESRNALAQNDYYSTASFCFTANLRLRELVLEESQNTERLEALTRERLDQLDEELQALELTTIPQLETMMIVRQRLLEAQEALDDENLTEARLAYAIERYNSAIAWSRFFDFPGPEVALDENHLREACDRRLREVSDRQSYIQFFYDFNPGRESQERARAYRDEGEYALCIFQASRAKAQADTFIDTLTASIDELPLVVDAKVQAAERVLAREQAKGIDPLLGLSYHEYAQSLRDVEPFNALFFASLSLELSNLDIYFPVEERVVAVPFTVPLRDVGLFLLGFATAMIVFGIIFKRSKPKGNPRGAPPGKKR